METVLSHLTTIASVILNGVLVAMLQRRSIVAGEFANLEKICQRLREEKGTLQEELGRLKERTDLQPLMNAILEWREEGRARFQAATEQLQKNTQAVETLIRTHEETLRHLFPARHKREHSEQE